MFDTDHTDDEDFTLAPSSKLASIFGFSNSSDNSNTSLTYKAPKQPKPVSSNAVAPIPHLNPTAVENKLVEGQTQSQSSVIFAKVVTLWQVKSGKNNLMGKYMVAITSNPSITVTELLIYQDKTNILIRETLNKSHLFLKYPNNFTAFCDSYRQVWNFSFDTLECKDKFLEYIGNAGCTIQEQNNNSKQDETDSHKSDQVPAKPDIISSDIKSSEATKEQILSRVTKMGQLILPRTVESNKNSEFSDYESESSCTETIKPVTAPRKLRKPPSSEKVLTVAPIAPEVSNRTYATAFAPNNNFFVPQNQIVHNQNSTGLVYSQPLPDYGLGHFLINQNAELKASLAEINAKLNNVSVSTDRNGNSCEDISVLNSKIKCQNLKIDNLSSDLQKMEKKLQDLTTRYEEKCKELQKVKSKNEQSGHLESEIISLKEKLKQAETLEDTIRKLESDIKERDNKISILNFDLKNIVEQLTDEKSHNENISTENSKLNKKLQEALLELNKHKDQLLGKENGEKNLTGLDKEKVSKIVKQSMNEAFRDIMNNFSDDKSYEARQIQSVLMQNLLETSFKLMNLFL